MEFATPIKTKADAGPALQVWVTHLQKQAGLKVKIIRCDGAGELVKSATMVAFFNNTGIKAETTAPYNPQVNGKAERLNQTIMERLRAVLLEYELPKSLLAELLMALFFLRKRSPTVDGTTTPFERFYGKKPDVSHLRVLGSAAYALKPAKDYNELDFKTLPGTIVGYAAGGHAFRIKSATTGQILIRRDVTADETVPAKPVHPSALPVSLFLPDGCSVDTPVKSTGGDGGGDRDVPGHDATDGTEVSTKNEADLDDTEDCTGLIGHGYFLRPRAESDQPSPSAMATWAAPPRAPLIPVSVAEAVARPEWCATPPKTRAEALARTNGLLWQQAMDEETCFAARRRRVGAPGPAHRRHGYRRPLGARLQARRQRQRDPLQGAVCGARLHPEGGGGLKRRLGAVTAARDSLCGSGAGCCRRPGTSCH